MATAPSPAPDAHEWWANLPAELTSRAQWCVAGPSKAPLYVGSDGALHGASVTDPSTWMPFPVATATAAAHGLSVGFVLAAGNGLTCIDLDVKDSTPQRDLDRYWLIVRAFDSYTETSVSGRGLHVWVAGEVGQGARRDGVEVYSQERFIICTGRQLAASPVRSVPHVLEALYREIKAGTNSLIAKTLVEVDSDLTDTELHERASNAANGDKYLRLCEGDWAAMGYPSQSEADFALLSIIAFYTPSNEQARRLFRFTALGKREKATRNDKYLNYALAYIRAKQAETQDVDLTHIMQAAATVAQRRPAHSAHVQQEHSTASPSSARLAPVPPLPWPPGFVGELAQYVYRRSARPVQEVAILTALGLMAGITGRAWQVSGTGLNVYLILVARSGIGKEGMHTGMGALLDVLRTRDPTSAQFVDFGDFASGPALMRACATNPSFVNVSGEWGRKLARLADDNAGRDSATQSLRTAMTNLYQKSAAVSVVGGITYSSADKNIASVNGGVAYSFLGESTPGTFYSALTPEMMEDGFLSRFTVVECLSDRPPLNKNRDELLPDAMADWLGSIAVHAKTLVVKGASELVRLSPDAEKVIDAFELECDAAINSSESESWRQMWNRAALKVLRIAAILAVGDMWSQPVIQRNHMVWALSVVRRDMGLIQQRIGAGDVGNGADAQEKKVLELVQRYLDTSPTDPLAAAGIVPRRWLQQRAYNLRLFSKHRAGPRAAIRETLDALEAQGYLAHYDKAKSMRLHNYSGECYAVTSLPSSGAPD